MNPIIADLIQVLEASPHKVATKEYVLNRLRESQIDYYYTSDEIPIMPPSSVRTLTGRIVREGDLDKNS